MVKTNQFAVRAMWSQSSLLLGLTVLLLPATVFAESCDLADPEYVRGGVRQFTPESITCPPGCEPGIPIQFWADYTIFQPEVGDDDFPPGLCFLNAEQIRIEQCVRPPYNLRCGPGESTRLDHIEIAYNHVSSQVLCQVQYFKPLHRRGYLEDTRIDEGGDFGGGIGSEFYPVASGFVQNFAAEYIEVTGAEWASLRDGELYGTPPSTGTTRVYELRFRAWNDYGDDSVVGRIIVSPARQD